MNIHNIKEPILVEYVKKFHHIGDDGSVYPKSEHMRKEANKWLVEHITDNSVREFIERFCFLNEKGDIITNVRKCYLGSIITDYPRHDFIKFLVDHKIYDIYSYNDFRKTQKSKVACCGFSETEQKWYGWTHRGIRAFGIGDTYFNYLRGKPTKTLEDCKKLAFYAVKELD